MPADARAPMLVDSHCHLTFSAYDADRDQVLARAAARGVTRVVNIGTDLEDSQAVIALTRQHRGLYATVGCHPNQSASLPADYLDRLRDLAQAPGVVGIGEIGLDFYRARAPEARQTRIFREQLELAAHAGLPVIIHCREAMPQVLRMLREWTDSAVFRGSALAQRPFSGVLHAFSGDREDARRAYAMDFALGLGGPVTFRNARGLHRLVPQLDLDRLMLETDAPYLTPDPHRGKRNEPGHVALVCQGLARLRAMPYDQIAAATTRVAHRFFGWEAGT